MPNSFLLSWEDLGYMVSANEAAPSPAERLWPGAPQANPANLNHTGCIPVSGPAPTLPAPTLSHLFLRRHLSGLSGAIRVSRLTEKHKTITSPTATSLPAPSPWSLPHQAQTLPQSTCRTHVGERGILTRTLLLPSLTREPWVPGRPPGFYSSQVKSGPLPVSVLPPS